MEPTSAIFCFFSCPWGNSLEPNIQHLRSPWMIMPSLLWLNVLSLAEMELIFPIADLIVLCFVLVARKVLMTHQCFGYCWAVLPQHQGCLANIAPLTSRLGVGKILGGDIARTADPNWPKGYSIPYDICSEIKAKRKEEEIGHLLPEQPLCALKLYFPGSGWTSPADGK